MSIMNKIIKWLRGPEEEYCPQEDEITKTLERHEAELQEIGTRYKDIQERAVQRVYSLSDEMEDRGINLIWLDKDGIKHSEPWTFELFDKIMCEEGTTLVFE